MNYWISAPNALGDTSALRERWLRKVFERAASESSATSTTLRRKSHSDDTNNVDDSNLDQNATIALLKEINADLTTGRIRQKMAVTFQIPISVFWKLLIRTTFHSNIRLETKSCRILPLTYRTKHDMT